jgi:uncharacterized protein
LSSSLRSLTTTQDNGYVPCHRADRVRLASLRYGRAGGGTAFLAVMAFAAFPVIEMRPTALLLNIVAAGYATWRIHRRSAIDWKVLLPLTVPSLVTALVGGLLVLEGSAYFILTGLLLIAAAALMAVKRRADAINARPIEFLPADVVGAAAGFVSGLTGVGGGVFLSPMLVGLEWSSPKGAAALSPPFILCNSVVGLMGACLAGQRLAAGTPFYAVGAMGGAVIGTAIGLRWMSERGVRYVLAAVLFFAGLRLLFR